MLLQTPLLLLQLAPGAAFVISGMPLLQPSIVHMLPSKGGVSLSSSTTTTLPLPSHESRLQSPLVGSPAL